MTTIDTTETLYAAARAWRDDDPDPTTRAELDDPVSYTHLTLPTKA